MSSPNPFGPQQPQQSPFHPRPPEVSRGPSCLMIVLFILGGGGILLGLVCCGGVLFMAQPPQATAAAQKPFELDDVPMQVFPDRGAATENPPRVQKYTASLGEPGGYYDVPGLGGKMVLYLPAGERKPQSLACILITGAGSN